MKLSHEIEPVVQVEHFDKNGNLKNIVDIPTSNKGARSCIEAVVRHSDGTIDKVYEFPIRSFVLNFAHMLYTYINEMSSSYKDTGNTTRGTSGDYMRFVEGTPSYGQSNYGILVGTGGATAVSPTQYNLTTKIAHGTDSGQLEYLPLGVPPLVTGVDEYSCWIVRAFTNRSGGTITVSEIGLVSYDGNYYYLMSRDTVDYTGAAISIAVANNQTLTVTYKIGVTEASGLTKNFVIAFRGMASYITNQQWYDVTNTSRTSIYSSTIKSYFRVNGGIGSVWGLLAGTGTDAINIDGYALGSKIVAGTGSGELYYNTPDYIGGTATGTYSYTKFGRVLTNLTTADITVNEFAWYGVGLSGTVGQQIMMGRWLTGGITLSPLESIRPCLAFVFYA